MEEYALPPEIAVMIDESNAARAAGGLAVSAEARADVVLDQAGTQGKSASGHQELADDGLVVYKPPELIKAVEAARAAAARVEPIAKSAPVGMPTNEEFARKLLTTHPNGKF